MCGFAQDLAIKLHKLSVFRQVFSLSIASDQVYRLAGTIENLLDALRRRVNDTLASLNPKGLSSSQRGMWQLNWGPVVWKTGTDASTTGPDLSWYVAYHDNLEFEDGSLHPTYVIAVAGTPAKSVNQFVDFDAYVSDGQFKTQPTEVSRDAQDAIKPYITLSTARAIHTLLTNPAPSVAGVRTLLNFINGVKSTKDPITRTLPRFVFTGHSVGGAIAPSVALALVSSGVIPVERTLTYSTAGPSFGNASFANLFERTFRARVTSGADGYRSWNINLVNTLDVVPQAWCHQHRISPSQNLNNIPTIYGTPMVPDAIRTTDTLIASISDSGVVFKPLPSRYFTGTRPSAPPASVDAFLQIAVQQHVQAYLGEVGISVPELDLSHSGLAVKTEADIRFNYPVINDFERAYRGEVGTGSSAGTWAGARARPAGSGTGTWTVIRTENGARTGITTENGTRTERGTGTEPNNGSRSGIWNKNGTETRTATGTGSGTSTGIGVGVGPGTGTNGTRTENGNGNGTETRASTGTGSGTNAGAETETGTGTGDGRVAVTPLSSLTVLKYGNPEYNLIPQSVQNHPLLIYRSCFPDWASASEVKSHLLSLAVVDPHRTGTLLIRDHFYTSTHKVLCVTVGQALLRFGGEGNQHKVDVEVGKGDVVIIPAGVPHRLLKDIGRDLEIVESYPKGTNVDSDSRRLGSRPQQTHLYIIASLAWFARDPIYGDQGPVLGC